MEASGIRRHEKVDLVNVTNGARLSTYVIEGPRGSGVIGVNGVNGPSARQAQVGDIVLIVSYASVTTDEAETFAPKVVFVNGENKITGFGDDPAEVPPGSGLIRGDTPRPVCRIALRRGRRQSPGSPYISYRMGTTWSHRLLRLSSRRTR